MLRLTPALLVLLLVAGLAQSDVRVQSLAQLRPDTAEARVRAAHFDLPGDPLSASNTSNSYHVDPPLSADVLYGDMPGYVKRPEAQKFREDLCGADAVFVGRATQSHGYLNRSESYLFTDFTFAVGEWIRPSNAKSSTVIVSTLGGAVRVGDTLYSSDAAVAVPTNVSMVVFGTHIKNTSSYQLAPAPVIIHGAEVEFSELSLGKSLGIGSTDKFLAAAREAAKECK